MVIKHIHGIQKGIPHCSSAATVAACGDWHKAWRRAGIEGREGPWESAGETLGLNQDSESLIFYETSSFIISKILPVAPAKLLFICFLKTNMSEGQFWIITLWLQLFLLGWGFSVGKTWLFSNSSEKWGSSCIKLYFTKCNIKEKY